MRSLHRFPRIIAAASIMLVITLLFGATPSPAHGSDLASLDEQITVFGGLRTGLALPAIHAIAVASVIGEIGPIISQSAGGDAVRPLAAADPFLSLLSQARALHDHIARTAPHELLTVRLMSMVRVAKLEDDSGVVVVIQPLPSYVQEMQARPPHEREAVLLVRSEREIVFLMPWAFTVDLDGPDTAPSEIAAGDEAPHPLRL